MKNKTINNLLYLLLISCYIYLFNKFINNNYEIIIIYFITLFIGYLFFNKYIICFNLILLIIYESFFINKEGNLSSLTKKGLSESSRDSEANKVSNDLDDLTDSKGEKANDEGADEAVLGKNPDDFGKKDAKKMEDAGGGDTLANEDGLDDIKI